MILKQLFSLPWKGTGNWTSKNHGVAPQPDFERKQKREKQGDIQATKTTSGEDRL